MHQPHTDKRSQTDKYGIDEIEVERAQKIDQIARSQSVTGRTEGGISAVAMATPGITFPFSLVERATTPASPPKSAMKTS